MQIPQITFEEPAMKPIFDRFIRQFGPDSPKSEDIAGDVKVVVWIRMINAFHPVVKPREIRAHFLKSFHPDTGTEQLTIAEKTRVIALERAIFKGGRAAK
ncbi:MAG: hypothetical protein K9G33_07740 [Sneathiella sp.]|nr:hypothetical protein [Sneathiella sp.]